MRNSARKLRRTFTLSPVSLKYIEQEAERQNAGSQSTFLDELLREKIKEQERTAYDAEVTAYYDSLTDEEVEEQRAWGQLGEQALALTEEELAHAQSAARRNLVYDAPHRPSGK